jgi:hypothetical protein
VKDLAIALENRSGALAEMGEALGRGGVSIEGGVFGSNGAGIAHFLFHDGAAILARILTLRWARRDPAGRAVIFSPAGEQSLRRLLGGE